MAKQKLLTPDTNNAKTIKGRAYGYATAVLYLAPVRLSGHNVCPKASAGCAAACLNTAGRGAMAVNQASRLKRTKRYFEERDAFMSDLWREIENHVKWSTARGFKPMVRLNGTSDIPWERVKAGAYSTIEAFPEVQFYDYTKVIKRALASRAPGWPANYHLVFSRSETNHGEALQALRAGVNVAVVYGGPLPAYADRETLAPAADGWPVVDGDRHDVRTDDGVGVVVGLKAKGKAKHDQSGFVINAQSSTT